MATATTRVTDASARFMNALVALEPETEDSGIYANKPGYHGTRDENLARDRQDGDRNYSVEHPLDLRGLGNKAAAYDWTHRKAQRGDYSSMATYGDRLEAAFAAKDPRLYGWREALGQTDRDKTAEGLDFDGWFRRQPDSTHEWHWHFSEHREFVESWDNKLCFLSVLKGESLKTYLDSGGKLLKPMAPPKPTPAPTGDWMAKLVKDRLPLLKQGSNGWQVGLWQQILQHHNYNIRVDNDFGSKTKAATVALQKRYGAESVDGQVGPETWTIGLTRKDQV